MKRVLTVMLALALVSPVVAEEIVGSGEVVTEARELPEFNAIEIRIAADVSVTIGKPTAVEIQGEDNILPLIKTEVEEGRLIISVAADYKATKEPNIQVTVADLAAVSIHGSGDTKVKGLDNESFTIGIAGSGDLRATGKTDSLTVSIAGSGDIQAYELSAQWATVTIQGSGDAKVSAAENLVVTIQGSGDVHYVGQPNLVSTINGSGDVKRHTD